MISITRIVLSLYSNDFYWFLKNLPHSVQHYHQNNKIQVRDMNTARNQYDFLTKPLLPEKHSIEMKKITSNHWQTSLQQHTCVGSRGGCHTATHTSDMPQVWAAKHCRTATCTDMMRYLCSINYIIQVWRATRGRRWGSFSVSTFVTCDIEIPVTVRVGAIPERFSCWFITTSDWCTIRVFLTRVGSHAIYCLVAVS